MSRASFRRAKSGITCAASDDRALPRPAGEDHDRVGLARAQPRRDDRDVAA